MVMPFFVSVLLLPSRDALRRCRCYSASAPPYVTLCHRNPTNVTDVSGLLCPTADLPAADLAWLPALTPFHCVCSADRCNSTFLRHLQQEAVGGRKVRAAAQIIGSIFHLAAAASPTGLETNDEHAPTAE